MRRSVLSPSAAPSLRRPGAAPARPRAAGAWATVNVCDTLEHPERDRHPRLDAGHAAQDARRHALPRPVPARRTSTWRCSSAGARLGLAHASSAPDGRAIESGWSFQFAPPAQRRCTCSAASSSFQWRRAGRVVAPRRGGSPSRGSPLDTAGADPRGSQRRQLRDRLAPASNSRGSFVITPVDAERLERAGSGARRRRSTRRARRPRSRTRPHERAASRAGVGHDRVAAARARCGRRAIPGSRRRAPSRTA